MKHFKKMMVVLTIRTVLGFVDVIIWQECLIVIGLLGVSTFAVNV